MQYGVMLYGIYNPGDKDERWFPSPYVLTGRLKGHTLQ
jgi:hypothetical protein